MLSDPSENIVELKRKGIRERQLLCDYRSSFLLSNTSLEELTTKADAARSMPFSHQL